MLVLISKTIRVWFAWILGSNTNLLYLPRSGPSLNTTSKNVLLLVVKALILVAAPSILIIFTDSISFAKSAGWFSIVTKTISFSFTSSSPPSGLSSPSSSPPGSPSSNTAVLKLKSLANIIPPPPSTANPVTALILISLFPAGTEISVTPASNVNGICSSIV